MPATTMTAPVRKRVPVPLTDIQEEFRAQLSFLKKSGDAYDAGDRDEFRRIATAVRVLVYDKGRSRSVASQLGLKGIPFRSYSQPVNAGNLLAETPLVIMCVGQGDALYEPCFDHDPSSHRSLPFDDWWSEEIFRSSRGVSMTRSVLFCIPQTRRGERMLIPNWTKSFTRFQRRMRPVG